MADHSIPLTQRQATKIAEAREAVAAAEARALVAQGELKGAQGRLSGLVEAILLGTQLPEGPVDVQVDRQRLVLTVEEPDA